MICYQYPKNAFVNKEALILFFAFVLIDLLLYVLHFLNLLRRVWSNNIIGGHYYLPLRYFGQSLQTLLSSIPKHCIVYIYYWWATVHYQMLFFILVALCLCLEIFRSE